MKIALGEHQSTIKSCKTQWSTKNKDGYIGKCSGCPVVPPPRKAHLNTKRILSALTSPCSRKEEQEKPQSLHCWGPSWFSPTQTSAAGAAQSPHYYASLKLELLLNPLLNRRHQLFPLALVLSCTYLCPWLGAPWAWGHCAPLEQAPPSCPATSFLAHPWTWYHWAPHSISRWLSFSIEVSL